MIPNGHSSGNIMRHEGWSCSTHMPALERCPDPTGDGLHGKTCGAAPKTSDSKRQRKFKATHRVFTSCIVNQVVYPLVNWHNSGKSPCWMGNLTISIAIFHSKLLVIPKLPSNFTQNSSKSLFSRLSPGAFPPNKKPNGITPGPADRWCGIRASTTVLEASGTMRPLNQPGEVQQGDINSMIVWW